MNRKSQETYAIKIVTKSKLTSEDETALKDEIAVLTELKHPHIIRLYDVFDEKDFYFLVTEQMMGGELFDRIVQKSYYNEKEARDTAKVLFEAIGFCHKKLGAICKSPIPKVKPERKWYIACAGVRREIGGKTPNASQVSMMMFLG